MTATLQALINSKDAETATTTQYTSPTGGKGTIIDQFTATNHDTTARTITVYLVPSGGAAGTTNVIVSAQSVAPGLPYICSELITHVLSPGDFIATAAGTANTICIRASGRLIT